MKSPKELFEAIVEISKETLGVTKLASDAPAEPKAKEAEVKAEAPVQQVQEIQQPLGVSKMEFDSAIAEIKEMYVKVLESLSPTADKKDVPAPVSAALSEDVAEAPVLEKEIVKDEVVAEVEAEPKKDEVEVEAIVEQPLKEEIIVEEPKVEVEDKKEDESELIHKPEVEEVKKKLYSYGRGRRKTTEDAVWSSLFGNIN